MDINLTFITLSWEELVKW